MTPKQQVIQFAKQNGIEVSSGKNPAFVRTLSNGKLWCECFDSHKEALEFFIIEQNKARDTNSIVAWKK